MNKPSSLKGYGSPEGPPSYFWESELYVKSGFKKMDTKYVFYDNSNIFKFLFFQWVNKWAYGLAREYVEPYKYHPFPVSDQIFKWQPIFSKHISDGLIRLETYQAAKSQGRESRVKKPYKSILFHAVIKTFWRRFLALSLGLIIINVLSLSVATVVKKLLGLLGGKNIDVVKTVLLLMAIIGVQLLDGLVTENINFYLQRIIALVHSLSSFVLFQHGICHRRKYFSDVNGYNVLNVCNQVLHSCSPDSECSKNPLFCQARRFQNKEISPKVFTLEWRDTYYISQPFESVKFIIEFIINFSYGIYLLSKQVKVSVWILYLLGGIFVIALIFSEILGAINYKFILYLRDYKITKCENIFPNLSLVKKMLFDDIAGNIITECRNNELSLILINLLLLFINGALFSTCSNLSFYIIQRYFIKSVKEVSIVTDINTAAFMTTFYIYMRIVNSMFLIPKSIKTISMSIVSYKRMDVYIRDCSPNFYITDNKYTGYTQTSSNLSDVTNQLPNDTVVYYKDASFTWVNSREDLLNKNYEPCLRNVNFELKRGEKAIVTGSKGSGKSNFVKSMLGEMTLVGGSMAVIPLHTSMPIFYASQDIWLQYGTIRSNITFGYKFDEHLYKTVLKAVELEYDISTWEKGDLRVVSDNAPSLSGGQRVRMEMARALYAYLVFHKVNEEYNNGRCSFLMCLDASFHGLDPFVSKTIFNNLFNLKTGLLTKEDLSVVLTTSKQCLETCSKVQDLNQIPNMPVYAINNQTLTFYSDLYNFVRNKKVDTSDFKYLSSKTESYKMNFLNSDMLSLCDSDENKRLGRMEITRSKYGKSFKTYAKDELTDVKMNRYYVLFKSAVSPLLLYILFMVGVVVMDNVKFVFSTKFSDFISKNIKDHKDGLPVDLDKVKSRATFTLNTITIFISVIISLSYLAAFSLTTACVLRSRRVHEYVLNSVLKNSSSVIKIKKQINQVLTYFTCDMLNMDDLLGLFCSLILVSSIRFIMSTVTLFTIIPITIPFFAVSLISVFYFVEMKFLYSTKLMFYGYFETCYHVNSVYEDAITGSSVNRSFKRDTELDSKFYEQRDYKGRCKFMLAAITSWATIAINWVLSTTILVVLLFPILLDKYTKYKMKVGYFGLALSLSMNVYKSFNFFASLLTHLEMVVVSLERFKYFVPPGQKLKFDKFLNVHEEYVVNPSNLSTSGINRTQLLRRRAAEFKADNKKFYGLRRLFYNPKLTVLDVGRYLTREHSGVELRNVCVYTSPLHTTEGMILRNINVHSRRSEIIGMVGRTGAGKTTLLSVLQNIIGNRTGQVLLDGRDLNEIPKVVLRQIIGVLPQLPFVFKGWTVRRFLDPRKLFTDDEIKQALNQCDLLNFINELPGGNKLDTALVPEEPVLYYQKKKTVHSRPRAYEKERSMSMELVKPGFESDTLLSNTQLRTLSLARLVLYRHFFRVIIVDEPPEEDLKDETSARSDELGVPIYELLQKFFNHCTTFVTAHDANVLKSCTSVWVIHDGRLVRTCKANEIRANESIATIIEESLKYN